MAWSSVPALRIGAGLCKNASKVGIGPRPAPAGRSQCSARPTASSFARLPNRNYAAAPSRATVRIPTASGDDLAAWLYLPEGDGPYPAVVMAHGIGAIKAG